MQDEKNKIERKKNKREIEVTALPKGRAAYWRYPEGAVRLNHLTAPMPDGASSHTHTKSEFSQAQRGGTAPTQGPTVQGDSTHPLWGQLVQAEGGTGVTQASPSACHQATETQRSRGEG